MQTPTVGRIVHYFDNGVDKFSYIPGQVGVPAIVITANELRPNLYLFTSNPDIDRSSPIRLSVPHNSMKGDLVGESYWDWPEVTPAKVVQIDTHSTTEASGPGPTYKQFSDDNGNNHRA